ncbi:hypothetical protein DPMN_181528 [Dreissena polymorpha]|uniref:Uncharacterized protein n=1 Tax=Dreissena polymorpha TaxID=45954 RepID=A0A9D4DDW3_DREPO|nr:hypothetical protein DPMN_181528 [Dreissena polymorpha]
MIFESGETVHQGYTNTKVEAIERHAQKPDDTAIRSTLGIEDTQYRPDDSSLYDSAAFTDSLKMSLKEQAFKFSETFKQSLFESK